MKITKTQLQNIIREELDALSEDEQLDEFFGPFSKKAKARKARIAKQKADAEEDRRQSAADAEEAAAGEAAREAERNSPEYKARQRKAALSFGGSAKGASDAENRRAAERARREKEHQRRKSMERDREAGRGPDVGYARKTQYYGVNNRKDESKVHQRIREEVAKAVKDALSEDEQLDEFFGPFSKKAKAKAKAKAAYDAKQKRWAQEEEEAEARMRAMDDEPAPKRGKSTQFGGGSPEESDFRANKIARDRKYAEEEAARRRRASGKNVDYARKTDRYGTNNRKDESKVRQRIREEVAKAVKAHFRK